MGICLIFQNSITLSFKHSYFLNASGTQFVRSILSIYAVEILPNSSDYSCGKFELEEVDKIRLWLFDYSFSAVL